MWLVGILAPQLVIKTGFPAAEAPGSNQWITREVPFFFTKKFLYVLKFKIAVIVYVYMCILLQIKLSQQKIIWEKVNS